MGAASCREIASIWARRDRWLSFLSTGEETVCHFDLTPKNVFVVDGEFVIIDWAFAGRGLLGLDVGPFAVNASADFFIDPEDVEVCSRQFEASYVRGLRDEGWTGETDAMRAVCAATTAVKFAWLLPAILLGAISDWESFNGRPKDEGILWWSRLVPFVVSESEAARAAIGM